jgi:predicted regulator of Ras-like GTPase activity (Roadblock/LC7/MglB family)
MVEEALKELKATRGVRVAALLSEDGFVVEEVREEGAPDPGLLSARAATVLGAAQALAQTLGQEGPGHGPGPYLGHGPGPYLGHGPGPYLEEVMVEYPEGALLLAPLPGHHLLLFLDGVKSLGRARLTLKRVLPRLEEALR